MGQKWHNKENSQVLTPNYPPNTAITAPKAVITIDTPTRFCPIEGRYWIA